MDVVLAASDAVLAQVSLTRRQARHIRKVLPYLLEETLLDAPETLWFAHGKPESGQYPVLACNRAFLESLADYLAGAGLAIRGVWVDADLLAGQAPLLAGYGEQPREYLVLPSRQEALVAPHDELDNLLALSGLQASRLTEYSGEASLDVLAGALDDAPATSVNLLHGELKPRQAVVGVGRSGWQRDWLPVMRFAAVVLVGVWGLFWLQKVAYERAAGDAYRQAEALYEELYPDDRAVAVERQFRQRLAALGANAGGQGFIQILAPLGAHIRGESGSIEVRRMQYDQLDGLLQLDLRAPDFDSLQGVRERIQSAGMAAEITEGRSQGDRVTARIKVGQGDAG